MINKNLNPIFKNILDSQLSINSVSNSTLKPKIVNHGNVFNTGKWCTFYCPECSSSICKNQKQCSCGQFIDWE